jgi:hypothetical protein
MVRIAVDTDEVDLTREAGDTLARQEVKESEAVKEGDLILQDVKQQ